MTGEQLLGYCWQACAERFSWPQQETQKLQLVEVDFVRATKGTQSVGKPCMSVATSRGHQDHTSGIRTIDGTSLHCMQGT